MNSRQFCRKFISFFIARVINGTTTRVQSSQNKRERGVIAYRNGLLPIEAEQTDHNSEDRTVFNNDRIHGIVLRLETEMTVLLVEGLDRSGIVDKSYNNIAVRSVLLLAHENAVTVKDTGVDHAVALDSEKEGLGVRHVLGRDRKIINDMFGSEDRLSCGNSTYDGHVHHLAVGQPERVVDDLNAAGLRRVPADIAVLLQRLKVRVHRGCGAKINGRADVAHRRRISLLEDLILNVIQYLFLFFRNLSWHGEPSLIA